MKSGTRNLIMYTCVAVTPACASDANRPHGDGGPAAQSGIELPSIQFSFCRPAEGDDLLPSLQIPKEYSIGMLLRNAEVIRSYPELKFEIRGYVDNSECGVDDCQALSLRRAQSVYDWLLLHGVSKNSLARPVGGGETAPLELEDSPEYNKINRRAEMSIAPQD